jgi:hypothetical protein
MPSRAALMGLMLVGAFATAIKVVQVLGGMLHGAMLMFAVDMSCFPCGHRMRHGSHFWRVNPTATFLQFT